VGVWGCAAHRDGGAASQLREGRGGWRPAQRSSGALPLLPVRCAGLAAWQASDVAQQTSGARPLLGGPMALRWRLQVQA
jgi:hypothetical protein